jgi:GT2 family glycosyltransferase
VVGYALRNRDGTVQPSVGRFPNLLRTLAGLLRPRQTRKYRRMAGVAPGPVDWVTGACMAIRSEALRRAGGMDEEFFLYYEEVALCQRMRALGLAVEYDPAVEVVHGHPLQGRRLSPALRLITRHSQLLYFRKFTPGWQFRVLCGIVGLEGAARRLAGAMARRGPERALGREITRLARDLARGLDHPARAVRDRAFAFGRPREEGEASRVAPDRRGRRARQAAPRA